MISKILLALKSLRSNTIDMTQYQSHVQKYIHMERITNFMYGTFTVSCLIVSRTLFSGVQGLKRKTTHRNLVPRLRMCGAIPPLSHMTSWCVQQPTGLFPYPTRFEPHTKFCMITGLYFRTEFKAINRNYMVHRYRIAKGAHHNRTNLSHFNMETKTEPVFATFGFDTSKRMECPEQCSGKTLVGVSIRYINP